MRIRVAAAGLVFAAACGSPVYPPAPPSLETEAEYDGLLTIPSPSDTILPSRARRLPLAFETGPIPLEPAAPLRLAIASSHRYPDGLAHAVVREGYELIGFDIGFAMDTGPHEAEIPLSSVFSLELVSGRVLFPSILTRERVAMEGGETGAGTVFFLLPSPHRPAALAFTFGPYRGRRVFESVRVAQEVRPLGAGAFPEVRIGRTEIRALAIRLDPSDSTGLVLDVEILGPLERGIRLLLYDAEGRHVWATGALAGTGSFGIRFPGAARLTPARWLGYRFGGRPRLLLPLDGNDASGASSLALAPLRVEGLSAEVVARRASPEAGAAPGGTRLSVALLASTDTPVEIPVSSFQLLDGARATRPAEDLAILVFPFHRVVRDLVFPPPTSPRGAVAASGPKRLRLDFAGQSAEIALEEETP